MALRAHLLQGTTTVILWWLMLLSLIKMKKMKKIKNAAKVYDPPSLWDILCPPAKRATWYFQILIQIIKKRKAKWRCERIYYKELPP